MVHISSVPRGDACNCKCPKCDRLLRAKKGVERTHHFAHKPGATCVCAFETVPHLLAKKIISDEKGQKSFRIPEYVYKKRNKKAKEITFSEKVVTGGLVQIDDVLVEKEASRGGFIPDTVIISGEKSLIVEIAVTHRVGRRKLSKIRRNNEAAIEIMLREEDALLDLESLRKVILENSSRKQWLFHPKERKTVGRFRTAGRFRAIKTYPQKSLLHKSHSLRESGMELGYYKPAQKYFDAIVFERIERFRIKHGYIPTGQELTNLIEGKRHWRGGYFPKD